MFEGSGIGRLGKNDHDFCFRPADLETHFAINFILILESGNQIVKKRKENDNTINIVNLLLMSI